MKQCKSNLPEGKSLNGFQIGQQYTYIFLITISSPSGKIRKSPKFLSFFFNSYFMSGPIKLIGCFLHFNAEIKGLDLIYTGCNVPSLIHLSRRIKVYRTSFTSDWFSVSLPTNYEILMYFYWFVNSINFSRKNVIPNKLKFAKQGMIVN